MKILVISNNPDRPSYRQRIGVHIGRLAEDGIEAEQVRYPKCLLCRLKLFFRAKRFDAVFLHKKRLNFLDAFLMRKFARKIIYDFDDAVMYDDRQPQKKSPKRLRDFARTIKIADVVIAGNTYLAEHAAKYSDNVRVLPTGLNVSDYDIEPDPRQDGKVRLVWIGSKSTLMYLKSLRPVLEEIGTSFDNVVLRIICDDFFELENMEVEKVPWTLQSQYRCLRESDIGLAPLSDDRFTRGKCGFKILQYMAASLPVVASGVGVNRDFVNQSRTGFIAQDRQQWIDYISKLIIDKDLRLKMGKAAKKDVADFDLEPISSKLSEIIQQTAT